jgi:hypothetical protein
MLPYQHFIDPNHRISYIFPLSIATIVLDIFPKKRRYINANISKSPFLQELWVVVRMQKQKTPEMQVWGTKMLRPHDGGNDNMLLWLVLCMDLLIAGISRAVICLRT